MHYGLLHFRQVQHTALLPTSMHFDRGRSLRSAWALVKEKNLTKGVRRIFASEEENDESTQCGFLREHTCSVRCPGNRINATFAPCCALFAVS